MDNFSANISVIDHWCNKCCTNNKSTTVILTNFTEFIDIQCGYSLRILNIGPNCVTINVNNGSYFVIRSLFVGTPVRICLPSEKCTTHYLKVQLNSITTD